MESMVELLLILGVESFPIGSIDILIIKILKVRIITIIEIMVQNDRFPTWWFQCIPGNTITKISSRASSGRVGCHKPNALLQKLDSRTKMGWKPCFITISLSSSLDHVRKRQSIRVRTMYSLTRRVAALCPIPAETASTDILRRAHHEWIFKCHRYSIVLDTEHSYPESTGAIVLLRLPRCPST